MKNKTLSATLQDSFEYASQYEERVREAEKTIRDYLPQGFQPRFGIVLGSGLGGVAETIQNPIVIPYSKIPNFPLPTVAGHNGNLVIGKIEGVPIIGLQGRKHYYEVANELFGTGMMQVTFPVHVLANLGVPNYFVTNAAGGLRNHMNVGELMVIRTHVNLLPNALLGEERKFKTIDGQTPARFPPMNGCYDKDLTNLLYDCGKQISIPMTSMGTYLATSGPTYETEGECSAFRSLGADAVGMSTTPEVIIARNRGMKAVGFSCITNVIKPDGTNDTNHDEVKATLNSPRVKERFAETIRGFFRRVR